MDQKILKPTASLLLTRPVFTIKARTNLLENTPAIAGVFSLIYTISVTLAVLFFIIGAIYGSFLNMLLWRLPRKETIGGRSYCPSCKHRLSPSDLIPIVSYLVLAGRCRYCRARIPIRYLAVELVCALTLSAYALWAGPLSVGVIFGAYIVLTLLGLLFFDLYYMILPDALMVPAIIIIAFYDIFAVPNSLEHFGAALLSALFFGIIYTASKGGWLGLGDVKLVFLIGLLLGYLLTYAAVVLAVWLGAAVGLTMVVSRRATMKNALPFGAFLCLTTLVFFIFRNEFSFPQTLFGW